MLSGQPPTAPVRISDFLVETNEPDYRPSAIAASSIKLRDARAWTPPSLSRLQLITSFAYPSCWRPRKWGNPQDSSLNQSHPDDGAVVLAGAAQEIDRYWLISGEGIAQKLQHALTSGLVLVVAQLKTEPFARLIVELDDRFNVQKVIRGAETDEVVDPEKSDPPLRLR